MGVPLAMPAPALGTSRLKEKRDRRTLVPGLVATSPAPTPSMARLREKRDLPGVQLPLELTAAPDELGGPMRAERWRIKARRVARTENWSDLTDFALTSKQSKVQI